MSAYTHDIINGTNAESRHKDHSNYKERIIDNAINVKNKILPS